MQGMPAAWVVYWAAHEPVKEVEDRQLVAVLPPMISIEGVRGLLEWWYVEMYFSLEQRLAYAQGNRDYEFLSTVEFDAVNCGAHPYLTARRGYFLRIEEDGRSLSWQLDLHHPYRQVCHWVRREQGRRENKL